MDDGSSVSQVEKPKTSRPKRLPLEVKGALFVFFLISALLLSAFPQFVNQAAATPPYILFLAAGLTMVVLTVVLFNVLAALRLGFGRTALMMALGYNCIIALVKIGLSPFAFYAANARADYSTAFAANPNSGFYYMLVAPVVLLLYVGVLRSEYFLAKKHLAPQVTSPDRTGAPHRKGMSRRGLVFFSILIAGGALVSGGAISLLPVIAVGFFTLSAVSYLSYILPVFGLPIVLALVMAIYLAHKGFEATETDVRLTGNTALLATFFWLGFGLILIYHILWIIFMVTLVQIWPFRTYSPK